MQSWYCIERDKECTAVSAADDDANGADYDYLLTIVISSKKTLRFEIFFLLGKMHGFLWRTIYIYSLLIVERVCCTVINWRFGRPWWSSFLLSIVIISNLFSKNYIFIFIYYLFVCAKSLNCVSFFFFLCFWKEGWRGDLLFCVEARVGR